MQDLGTVHVRRASPTRRPSSPKKAGFHFAFTWQASLSRRARHVWHQGFLSYCSTFILLFLRPSQVRSWALNSEILLRLASLSLKL